MHSFFGTPLCMAPEILDQKNFLKISYTKKVDIWSLGILVYYICCNSYPFFGENQKSIL